MTVLPPSCSSCVFFVTGAAMMAYTVACQAEATARHDGGAAAGAARDHRTTRDGKARGAAGAGRTTITPPVPAADETQAPLTAAPLPVFAAALVQAGNPGPAMVAGAKPPLAPAGSTAVTRAAVAVGQPRTVIETLATSRPSHPQPATAARAARATTAAVLASGIRAELERAAAAAARPALPAVAGARY